METSSPYLSVEQKKLYQALLHLIDQLDTHTRVENDPIRFPKRYDQLADQEVVSLIAALLSYGRVKAIGQAIEKVLSSLGPSPAQTALEDAQIFKDQGVIRNRFKGFIYRFTREDDLQKLWYGIGFILLKYNTLGNCFYHHDQVLSPTEKRPLIHTYQYFYDELIELSSSFKLSRGFNHLFSNPRKGSALKRINMWLRWLVRGPDQVDLGIWSKLDPSRLLIPLDVHIFRLSHALGFTTRKASDLKTVHEITTALKALDPNDPIRFDFALAHLGISGACLGYRTPKVCVTCPLESLCRLPAL